MALYLYCKQNQNVLLIFEKKYIQMGFMIQAIIINYKIVDLLLPFRVAAFQS